MRALSRRFAAGIFACVLVAVGLAAGLLEGHLNMRRLIGLAASIAFGPVTGVVLCLRDGAFTSAATWALSMIVPIGLFGAFFRSGKLLLLVGGFVGWLLIGLVLTISAMI